MPHREIVALAEEIVLTDAQYREKIIAEARRIVEQWHAEGVYGPRGGPKSPTKACSTYNICTTSEGLICKHFACSNVMRKMGR